MALTSKTTFKTDIATGQDGDRQSDLGHATIHNQIGDTLNKLQDDVGVDGETSTSTLKGHIADISNPHSVTASQVGNTTAQWNADKIQDKTVETPIIPGAVPTYNSTTGTIQWTAAGSGDMNTLAYDPAGISQQIVGTTATQTITNKTIDSANNTITVTSSNVSDLTTATHTELKADKVTVTEGTTSANGIDFGSDVNLYRVASNALKTDDNLVVGGTSVDIVGGYANLNGGAGIVQFESETPGVYDTNIYRESANALRTNDQFTADLDITTVQQFKSFTANEKLLFSSTNGAYDVNLYAVGANILQTDDNLQARTLVTEFGIATQDGSVSAEVSTPTSTAFQAKDNNDNFQRYTVDASGKTSWGDGTGVVDTNLYRSAANTLKTDDALVAGTSLQIASSTTVNGVIDDDTMATASATTLATSESIKAYVDSVSSSGNWTDAGGWLEPNTDGDDMRVYDGTGADYTEVSHDGTDANVTTNAGHIILTPATSKLVKVAVLRQDNTTNAYENNSVILTGWGYLTPASGDRLSETVTFGITFSQLPIVLATQLGKESTSVTDIDSFDAVNNSSNGIMTGNITTSSCTINLEAKTTDALNEAVVGYGYTWIAIGQL